MTKIENITFYISSDVFWKNDLGPLVLETDVPCTYNIRANCLLKHSILCLSKQVACFSLFGEYMDVLQDRNEFERSAAILESLCYCFVFGFPYLVGER